MAVSSDFEVKGYISPSLFTGYGSRTDRPFYTRICYQLVGMLLFCVVLPLGVRQVQVPGFLTAPETMTSLILIGPSVVLTYFLWRRLHVFPGTNPISVAGWTVGIVFAAVLAIFMLTRIEYSRTVLFSAPFLSFAWLVFISSLERRDRPLRMGVLPAASACSLPRSDMMRWVTLSEPPVPAHYDGYVANLHHEYCPSWEKFVVQSTLEGVPVYHTKQIIEQMTGRVAVDHLSENSFGSVLPNLSYLVVKRVLDMAALAIVAAPLAIVALCVALLIKFREGGPIIFRQKRLGRRGKPFTVYKFRTMRVAQTQDDDCLESAKTKKDDPRITPLGRRLRKYRLDELPQLLNILRGEMSWIGPRPEATVLGRSYEAKFPYYRYRYAVRPGITGWAQVRQGHVIDDDDVRIKLEYDFYYVKNVSLWLDVTIALKTIQTVIAGRSGNK